MLSNYHENFKRAPNITDLNQVYYDSGILQQIKYHHNEQ